MPRQFRMHAAENFRRGFQDDQANLRRRNAAIAPRSVAMHEVVEFADELDAGVTAADRYERQQLAPELRILRVVGVLEDIEDALAEHHGVFERLEVPGMLGRSGNAEIIRAASQGDHQSVVVERAGSEFDAARIQINGARLIAPEAKPARPSNVAKGLNNMPRIDVARSDLREKRGKQKEVLLVHEDDFNVRTPVKLFFEVQDGLQAAEAAAEHDDTFHRFIPSKRKRSAAEDALAKVALGAENAIDPRDAHESGLHFDQDCVALLEAAEVIAVHRQGLEPRALAPRPHDESSAPADQAAHIELFHHDRGMLLRLCLVQISVDKQQHRKQPGQRNESEVDALEQLYVAPAARAPFNVEAEPKHEEEQHARKYENGVEFERRIKLADRNECNRAEKKPRRAPHQAAPQHHFGSRRGQPASQTLVALAFGSAIETSGHREFPASEPSSDAMRDLLSSSCTAKINPIPRPGSMRRTEHSIRSGSRSEERAANRAPSQRGSAKLTNMPPALMSRTSPRKVSDPHSISNSASSG